MPPQFKPQFDPANKLPTLEKPPRGHTFLVILTIILILTGAFGVWYFLNPPPEPEPENLSSTQPNQFADWKTYRNEKYGYEFKYPDSVCAVNLGDIGGCAGTPDQHLNADVLLLADSNYKLIIKIEGSKVTNTYDSALTNQILSTFKFIEPNTNNKLLRACPESWYLDQMPGPPDDKGQREYLVYQGVRREIIEFDMDWVKANCNLEKQIVY